MKHIVTITHEVEAENWDLAVEVVLRAPLAHMGTCSVKTPGKRLVHVSPATLKRAAVVVCAQRAMKEHAETTRNLGEK